MQKQRTYDYIWFGGVVQYLRFAGDGTRIHGEDVILENLGRFKKTLEKFDLPVSAGLSSLSGLDELSEELEGTEKDATLTAAQAKTLSRLMKQHSDTIHSETKRKVAYIVGEKRWETNKLLDSPGALFSPGVFDSLDEEIRRDLGDACKCIAFELPTSAAFHLMRAMEALVRVFYRATVKRDRMDPLLWGPMLAQMRSRSKPPPAVLLNQLDHIREDFRNPTQHPDAFYDIQEVQDLFGVCIDAIHRVMREMAT